MYMELDLVSNLVQKFLKSNGVDTHFELLINNEVGRVGSGVEFFFF